MKDIDWNYVSSNPQAKGLSNLELAKKDMRDFVSITGNKEHKIIKNKIKEGVI
ncbi:hypothetical protein [Bacillus toyonensis]|uniref:hypothetical protein n=1 Tax=Bacillus toyonensis TaxID=155322 RepID=UPI0015D51F17|nr:hypothetical protein [Bacillus toyonensis]